MKSFFACNRKNVLNSLDEKCIVVLFAGKAPIKRGDQYYNFTPDRNFYYLTGIDKTNVIFLAYKDGNHLEEYLFIERYDEVKAKWDGKTLSQDDAKAISEIEKIKYLDEFDKIFSNLVFRNNIDNIMLDLENRYLEICTEAFDFAKVIKKNYPYMNIKNIYHKIGNFRLIKSNCEIENMKNAIDITKKGILSIMKNIKPNMMEYEAEAYFDFEIKKNGVKEKAFETIFASGKNATVLHYQENNCKIENNSLVLIDLGASYKYYSADISRTFPSNGKFSNRQKEIYNIVLTGQIKVIEAIKPGLPFKRLNEILKEHYSQELKKIGLIEKDEEIFNYYYHGISHFLGLETHDIGGEDSSILKKGMVITVEPGLYIQEEGIGIRIEDDILVTESGYENLSENIIKTVEDIENFMNGI